MQKLLRHCISGIAVHFERESLGQRPVQHLFDPPRIRFYASSDARIVSIEIRNRLEPTLPLFSCKLLMRLVAARGFGTTDLRIMRTWQEFAAL